MATAKKTNPYAIHYNDGSYMVFDLTLDDFDRVKKVMFREKEDRILECSIGIINLCDMRFVIKQKPIKKEKSIVAAHPNLTAEEIDWLAQNKEAWKLLEDEEEGVFTQ